MTTDNRKLLSAAKDLQELLNTIHNLLQGFLNTWDGNKEYIVYCHRKTKESQEYTLIIKKMSEDMYNVDTTKRKEPDTELLTNIIRKQYSLLDDMDTAGDMFKPTWDMVTSTVEQLHRLRHLYVNIKENTDDLMTHNGNCTEKVTIANHSTTPESYNNFPHYITTINHHFSLFDQEKIIEEATTRGFKKGTCYISIGGGKYTIKGDLLLRPMYRISEGTEPSAFDYFVINDTKADGCIYTDKTKEWAEIIK